MGRGRLTPRDGGWAVVNYDTLPGEIRPDLGLGVGLQRECFLKGTIHELGHAFGLPHIGPDLVPQAGQLADGPEQLRLRRAEPRPTPTRST